MTEDEKQAAKTQEERRREQLKAAEKATRREVTAKKAEYNKPGLR